MADLFMIAIRRLLSISAWLQHMLGTNMLHTAHTHLSRFVTCHTSWQFASMSTIIAATPLIYQEEYPIPASTCELLKLRILRYKSSTPLSPRQGQVLLRSIIGGCSSRRAAGWQGNTSPDLLELNWWLEARFAGNGPVSSDSE